MEKVRDQKSQFQLNIIANQRNREKQCNLSVLFLENFNCMQERKQKIKKKIKDREGY